MTAVAALRSRRTIRRRAAQDGKEPVASVAGHASYREAPAGLQRASCDQALTWNIASISTALPSGSEFMPMALRAPLPALSPKTSVIRSLKPLITRGVSVKFGMQLTTEGLDQPHDLVEASQFGADRAQHYQRNLPGSLIAFIASRSRPSLPVSGVPSGFFGSKPDT